jgi:hypothetical protein
VLELYYETFLRKLLSPDRNKLERLQLPFTSTLVLYLLTSKHLIELLSNSRLLTLPVNISIG